MGMYDELSRLEEQTPLAKPKMPSERKNTVVQPPAESPQQSPPEKTSQRHHVISDVMASRLDDATLRQWRDMIENGETHNSALRLSVDERETVEDCILTLRRKFKIKTSMNELARLGLLALVLDLEQRKEASLVYRVKKL